MVTVNIALEVWRLLLKCKQNYYYARKHNIMKQYQLVLFIIVQIYDHKTWIQSSSSRVHEYIMHQE